MLSASGLLGLGATALELGCGIGIFTSAFAGTGARVVAIDVSPDLIALGRDRAPGARFVLTDACELPFGDETFDVVLGSSVLHHLEVRPVLREIRRVLRSGGRATFTEPNMLNPQIALQKTIPSLKRWLGDSPNESAFFAWQLAGVFRAAGFRQVHVEPFDFMHPLLPGALLPAVDRLGRALERVPVLRHIAGSLHVTAVR